MYYVLGIFLILYSSVDACHVNRRSSERVHSSEIHVSCNPKFSEYCLNGGQCHMIESIKEVYCICADGFNGLRCAYKYPTIQKTINILLTKLIES